jgi:hypothetical protein
LLAPARQLILAFGGGGKSVTFFADLSTYLYFHGDTDSLN